MEIPEFLERDADGEICLKGHRLRLIDVAARYDEGHSAEGIVIDHYPTLGLPLVHKVIAFFLEHENEVRDLIRANAEAMNRLEAGTPRAGPSHAELLRRFEAMRRVEAS